MIERFQGVSGRRRLVDALRAQQIVEGNEQVAQALADAAELRSCDAGETILREGGGDDHIIFILSGHVAIVVKDRTVGYRRARQHVGEMALIDPQAPRSASVVALEPTVTATVTEPCFTDIADANPRLWRLLSVELAERLRQRNIYVRPRNKVPRIFIGSSSEALPAARELAQDLKCDEVEPILWSQGGVFGASDFVIESLDAQVEQADFAALVLGADDVVISRHKRSEAPRDNVIFELGLFMGLLKRQRTYLIVPAGTDVKIPSDLLGITQLRYAAGEPIDLPSRIAPVCDQILARIRELGPR